MRRPRKIKKKTSKRNFTKYAKKTHRKNTGGRTAPMRGGIRL